MQQQIMGWDIGGAHIKTAILEPNEVISKVYLYPCPLWKGLDYLKQMVRQILKDVSINNCLHAITMTGELVDLFEDREQGVENIIDTLQNILAGNDLYFYAGKAGFIKAGEIQQQHYTTIASANWFASASMTALKVESGLFIDIGSTTTDILVIADHKVRAIGLTDYDRLVSDELVYTGVIRTAVMAVAHFASLHGKTMGLMAEYFSTMADVYRVTAELNEIHDQSETADGAEKTVLASAKRLSRMTGYEFKEADLPLWQLFALNIKNQQINRIKTACEKQLSRNMISKNHCFIGAGVGRFLVRQIADQLGYGYQDFNTFVQSSNKDMDVDIADCAPAVSVALLLSIKEKEATHANKIL